MNLRQAAEIALKYFEDAHGLEDTEVAIKEALRQALDLQTAIERGTKAWADVPDATKWVEELRGNDTLEESFTLDRGCYERGCVALDERDGDGVIMLGKRVDETAKSEHEPYDQTALELCEKCGWKAIIPDEGCLVCARNEQEPVMWSIFDGKYHDVFDTKYDVDKIIKFKKGKVVVKPLYTAPPKKQWVGLSVNEVRKFYEKYTDREELIYAIDEFLEEKNSG